MPKPRDPLTILDEFHGGGYHEVPLDQMYEQLTILSAEAQRKKLPDRVTKSLANAAEGLYIVLVQTAEDD